MAYETSSAVPSFVAFLAEAQRTVMKSDEEMAEAMDLGVNVYRQLRNGQVKLPIGKVPVLARALDVSVSQVLSIALADMSPELFDVVNKTWTDLSKNERKLVAAYRHLIQDRDAEAEPVVLDGKNIIAIFSV